MSFSTRLALSIAVLVACCGVLGAAALFTVADLHGRLSATDEMYDELRGLYEVGQRAATARLLLSTPVRNEAEVRRQLIAALREIDRVVGTTAAPESEARAALVRSLHAMRLSIEGALVAGGVQTPAEVVQSLNACLSDVAALAAAATRDIRAGRRQTTARVETARWTLGSLVAGASLVALVLGLMQHRSVSRPLRALSRGVEQIVTRGPRGFQPIAERGPREFRRLMRQFNDMAGTIDALERSLAQQVEVKNEQLLRSERLAGVGYLAAGVAHEINNPLGVIGGYAQTMLRRLGTAGLPVEMASDLDEALRTITDEVFRCHEITAGLLQMTRREQETEAFDLRAVVARAVDMLRHHPSCRDRQLELEESVAVPLLARGSRSQLTQVFLNLLTNALEAVEPGTGLVRVTVTAQAGSALVCVSDNGCGMTPEAMARVFDPLFSDKPRRGLSGFGLGLSVSHAIIERHGGRIDVSSDGPGQGSTFLIELPALWAASAGVP